MSAFLILSIIISYVAILLLLSILTGKNKSNIDFFRGARQSKWYVVSFGMIGATLSGISFISVPGWIREINMTYMQMVFGFFFGYIVVVYVLLPIYYKLNLTTIYEYLGIRFGKKSHKTGTWFFLLSKMVSASARLYVVILVIQQFVFDEFNIPFYFTKVLVVLIICFFSF